MNDTKLVLVAPPLLWEDKLRLSFQPPLNLLYLTSYLRSRDLDVELVDVVSLRCTPDETVDRVLACAPTLVGIPLYYASLDVAFDLVSRLEGSSPTLQIVGGGPCMTMEPERMMREGRFDFGVVGEGEETLAELLAVRAAGRSAEGIPGLALREGDRVTVSPRRPAIANLDLLPYLDYSVVDNDFYFRAQEKAHVPRTLFLTSSRGCSFRCSYCCTPHLWPGGTRRYSPRRLADEMAFHKPRFPGADFGFCDDSFFSSREWLLEFIERVGPLGVKYQCIGRADHLGPALIGPLVASGLSYVAFGVETGTRHRQRSLGKNVDFDALIRNIRELAAYNVTTKCFFMLGFPDETPAEMAETINLASTLKRHGMTSFSIFPVTVYPGTELAKQFVLPPFRCGLDAHLPEIIRDDLGIDGQKDALLDSPFNPSMSYRQLFDLVSMAYERVERAETVQVEEIERLIRG